MNLRNAGTFPFLPDDAVIEVPAHVDRSGVRAVDLDPLEPLYAGLVAHVTAYEHLALEAALHGGRRRVFEALLAHPLVGQVAAGRRAHRPAASRTTGSTCRGPDRRRVLAIDAGNSKTDVCVVSADGELLGSARGGPFRPAPGGCLGRGRLRSPPQLPTRCRRAGSVSVRHVAACLANADLPVEHEALEAAIAEAGWAPSYEVVNDTFALLRAGLDASRGVAVVCGAGINCTGVLEDGTTVRFAAVGHISGDWGGGGHLWQEAMWWAARAEDGRGPDTVLRKALPAHLGLSSMATLIEAVHLRALPEERCMELTPLLFSAAESGDEVAAGVVRRQAEEVVALAATAIRRLGATSAPIDVVLGGGVLTAGHRLLMGEITRLLADQVPLATARVVQAPPIVGAALLALDRVEAASGAQERLREAFRVGGDLAG